MMGARSKISAISLNVKIDKRKLVDICGYKLPINVQNFMQKDSAQAKISSKVVGGGLLFLTHPVVCMIQFLHVFNRKRSYRYTDVEAVSQHESQWSWNNDCCEVKRDAVNHEQRQWCNRRPEQLVAPFEIKNIVGESQQRHAADWQQCRYKFYILTNVHTVTTWALTTDHRPHT